MFLTLLVDIHGLFLWMIKKGVTITNIFQKLLNEYNHEPNQVRVDKDSEFDKRSVKSWLQDVDIEIY